MSKKKWAYVAIAAAVAMLWAIHQVDNKTTSSNSLLASLQADLETLGRLGSPNATPYIPYALLGLGAWFLFG